MLSRIADSLFWMARYMERTDGMLRMLKINLITALDRSGQADFTWLPVLKIFTSLSPEAMERLSRNSDEVLMYMIFNRENENSIRSIVGKARENTRGAQDHVTKEVWESINEFYHKLNEPGLEKAIVRGEQIVMLSNLINQYLLFTGVAEVTMPRSQGWNYINLGKFIERGVITADILDIRFSNMSTDLANPSDVPYWRNLLLSLNCYELYLKRYQGSLDGHNVADLAILNPQFPRSLAYCLFRLDRTIQHLADEYPESSDSVKKIIGRLRAKVEFADMESISSVGLHTFLTEMKNNFYQFSNALGKTYFAYN
ncbi:MAG: alpha-E domain-containing protein [Saprospiraceae bacterium]|nr:alpha-E domain-containing protein [Saprospiraceae bacterium]